jgi:AcrR family transcriptional regulator
MVNTDLKERIKETAVDHFNKNGYYGTTIRNIANDVNCSLPMIYYYYKNKKELFDEIIKKDFFDILNKQASQVEPGNIVDLYTQFIYGLNDLSDYDKQVYRLGIKVYLSFDGSYGRDDYVNLTLKDLRYSQQLFSQIHGKTDPCFHFLIQTKESYLKANNLPLY